jgi:membrane-bound inhibitor of C-type lysozyme
MTSYRTISLSAALFVAGVATTLSPPAFAQTFQNYRCADGTKFIVGFFQYDSRAHMQIDGGPLTLARRFALSGTRYSGGGITLKVTKAGATIRHARRPATTCELT